MVWGHRAKIGENAMRTRGLTPNLRVNPPHPGVTALANGGNRRAAGRAGYAPR
jgi:hypothetical protein